MTHCWRIGDADAFVTALSPAGIVEKTWAIAKKNRNDVDFHFIDKSGFQVLLGDARAAAQSNVFALRGSLGLLKRRVNSFVTK